MKKLLSIAFFLAFFSLSWLQAQSSTEPSGIYQGLTLGVDSQQGVVTGYYEESFDPPNMPHVDCSFYLFGKKQGDHYAVQAWSPGDKKPAVTAGGLAFYSTGNKPPSALLKLEKLDRDCTALEPNLAKGQGAFFDLQKNGAWTEVRIVATPKSLYYQKPELSSPTRDSAKRGTVLTVAESQSGWALVQSNQKSKGWIREADLYPTSPSGESAAAASASPAVEKVPVPTKQADLHTLPMPKPGPELESKDALLARLRALNAQAFDMALQVLKNPTKRNALSAKRIEMEKDFNLAVSKLKNIAPSAYVEESKEIFETFLDLQFVQQAKPVVSLRLNQRIQGFE